jgi:IS4 transposase
VNSRCDLDSRYVAVSLLKGCFAESFEHLFDLFLRGVHWVTRTKSSHKIKVLKRNRPTHPKILADEEVRLARDDAYAKKYPERMRRVRALVDVDGEEREMEFLTNNLEWSPRSVADLYRCRWSIEVFFKQIKQSLKLSDFLGNSANAVRWQVWTALLCYLLLRFQAFLSQWNHSFTRLFTVIRAALWQKIDLLLLLKSYGTAGGCFRATASPNQAYYF